MTVAAFFETEPWWYWAVAVAAALIVVTAAFGPPLCDWFERRADQRDAETWSRQPGSVKR